MGKKIGGVNSDYSNGIVLDASGNVYTTGQFQGTVDFDPGVGTTNLTSAGFADIFVSKLDAAGNFVWAKNMGGTKSDVGCGIALDASGNVYTTGFFYSTADFDPSAGGSATITPVGQDDIFISKLDASGNFVWAKSIGGTYYDYGYDIAIDALGSVYATGGFQGVADFDPSFAGTYTLASTENTGMFVFKLSCAPSQPGVVSGNTSLCVGSISNYSLSTVQDATSYVWTLPVGCVGTSSSNTILATVNSSGVFSVTANNTCGASTQQTLAVTANPLPVLLINSTNATLCVGESATLTAGGANIYTWNIGNGAQVIVSPGSTTTYSVSGIDANGCSNAATFTQTVESCTGLEKFESKDLNLKVYPNPNNGQFIVETENVTGIYVTNIVGAVILNQNLKLGKNTIEMDSMPKGIYFLKSKNKTFKIILQ